VGRVVLWAFLHETIVFCSRRRDWRCIQYRTDVGPVCVVIVQVALMSEVATAGAAMDAHAGVPGVAEAWLGFLSNLALEDANKVRYRVWNGWCLGFLHGNCGVLQQTPGLA
jgi:hypothetical protein